MEIQLNKDNFDREVLRSQIPVLVDFWADWCGPCRMVAPAVAAIADEFSGKLKVAKLNVDEAPDIAARYRVMSIPTFMIFKNGKSVETFVGGLPKAALAQRVAPYIA